MPVGECEALRGGFFNENSSSTWTGVSLQSFNDTKQDPAWAHFNPPGITDVGYETMHFPGGAGQTLYGFGLALNQIGNNSNMGMLGLGSDSLLLDTCVKKNYSPSRGWSLDVGSQSVNNPRDGELVIGGHNRNRRDGSYIWKNVSDLSGDRPCPLRTAMTDIHITFKNGTQVPLKSSGETITACIEPYDNIFRFTPGMLLNWKQISGFDPNMLGIFQNNAQNLSFTEYPLPYVTNNLFEFTLSITLDSGYTTTIPSYEMIRPLVGWNAIGEKQQVPGVSSVGVLDTPTGTGEVPTLGKVFLSQSYLAVDYANEQFGLAKANLNPPATGTLVPFSCEQANTTSNSTSPGTTPVPAKSHTGAIVGGAVGGSVVLIALAAIYFFFFVKHHKKRTLSQATANTYAHSMHKDSVAGGPTMSMHSSVASPYGMPSPNQGPHHQMYPVETYGSTPADRDNYFMSAGATQASTTSPHLSATDRTPSYSYNRSNDVSPPPPGLSRVMSPPSHQGSIQSSHHHGNSQGQWSAIPYGQQHEVHEMQGDHGEDYPHSKPRLVASEQEMEVPGAMKSDAI